MVHPEANIVLQRTGVPVALSLLWVLQYSCGSPTSGDPVPFSSWLLDRFSGGLLLMDR